MARQHYIRKHENNPRRNVYPWPDMRIGDYVITHEFTPNMAYRGQWGKCKAYGAAKAYQRRHGKAFTGYMVFSGQNPNVSQAVCVVRGSDAELWGRVQEVVPSEVVDANFNKYAGMSAGSIRRDLVKLLEQYDPPPVDEHPLL